MSGVNTQISLLHVDFSRHYLSLIGCMWSVKTLLFSVGVSQVCSPYSWQLCCYSFVSIRISWLLEKKYTNLIIGESHVCSSFSVQLRQKTFVIIRISSLVESHIFRLTSIKSGFRWNAMKRISLLAASNASNSYSAHIRYKDKTINTCCFSRFNSSFSRIFRKVTLHVVRI